MDFTVYTIFLLSLTVFCLFLSFQKSERFSPRFFNKVIPKDSFWRKLYPFKEYKINPLKYIKFIPFFISTVVLIIVVIIYIIYWISPSLVVGFLSCRPCKIAFFVYLCVGFLYSVIFID